MAVVSQVSLYAEPRCRHVDYEAVAGFMRESLDGIQVRLLPPFFEEAYAAGYGDGLPQAIAAARVRTAQKRVSDDQEALPGEVDYETRRLENRDSGVYGLLYDAEMLSLAAAGAMAGGDARQEKVHIIVTNQLIGTWDFADNRYHARVMYCGSPAIISLPGLVEAPARDREYYLAKRGATLMGLSREQTEEMAREYSGDHLQKDDERMTDILKGYALQPVAYRMTGEPFCEDGGCRLYNAHWQAEMLAAQLNGSGLCQRHRRELGGAE